MDKWNKIIVSQATSISNRAPVEGLSESEQSVAQQNERGRPEPDSVVVIRFVDSAELPGSQQYTTWRQVTWTATKGFRHNPIPFPINLDVIKAVGRP